MQATWLKQDDVQFLTSELQNMFVAGEIIIFQWIEWYG